MLAMALCLSVTSRCSVKTVKRIELIFGTEATYPALCCMEIRNSSSPKVKVLSSETLFANCGLKKFRLYTVHRRKHCKLSLNKDGR